jgi:hypothetical protein
MKEEPSYPETSVLAKTTRRDIQEDAILYLSIVSMEGKEKLVVDPRWWLDTRKDWPTDLWW